MSNPPDLKRRGAQPGNQNARTHGFYTRDFPSSDFDGLDAADPTALLDEIALMRVLLRRLLAYTPEVQNLAQAGELVRAASLIAFAITRLVKTQQSMTPSDAAQLSELLSQALADLDPEQIQLDSFPH